MRSAIFVSLTVLLVVLGHASSHAAVSCADASRITHESYRMFWNYEQGDNTYDPATAIRLAEDKFRAIGIDFGTPLEACDDYTKVPYDMLFVYLHGAALEAGPVAREGLDAVLTRLRYLNSRMSVENLFFATYVRGLVTLYKGAHLPIPADLQAWFDDPRLAPPVGCMTPYYQDAWVLKAVAPAYPFDMENAQTTTAVVELTISTTGRPSNTRIVQSTENPALDKAALDAAQNTTYVPKTLYCEPVTSKYLYRVNFKPYLHN